MLLPMTVVLHHHSTPWSAHPRQTHLQSCPMSTPTLLCCPTQPLTRCCGHGPQIWHRGKRAQLGSPLCPSSDPTHSSPCLHLPTLSVLPNQHQARGSVFLHLLPTPGHEPDPSVHLHPILHAANRIIRVSSLLRLAPHHTARGEMGLWSYPKSLKVNNND